MTAIVNTDSMYAQEKNTQHHTSSVQCKVKSLDISVCPLEGKNSAALMVLSFASWVSNKSSHLCWLQKINIIHPKLMKTVFLYVRIQENIVPS